MQVIANGIEIEVEADGPEVGPAVVLIRGLSTQLTQWPEGFLDAFRDAGFRTVRFDNRDAGLSKKFDEAGTPGLAELMTGAASPPYTLADMAMDVVGVLDALAIERAHVFGLSLGGMVTQHVGFSHGERCLSLASVMSTSGEPGLPSATPEALAALTTQPEDPTDRDCVIAHGMRTQRVISSPGFPPSDAELHDYIARAYDRCYCPSGSARQMAAVLADGGRAERLATIQLPTLVLHGGADPLIPLACGEDTARHIPGAKLEVVEGMGHDVNAHNADIVVSHLIAHARRATG
jgi:pimeloyl-ACP methyl ester carboxylesterase